MSDAALIRVALPGHTVKRLALLAEVPFETARSLLYRSLGGLASTRRRELARALLLEMQRQDREERARAMARLAEMAGVNAADPVGGTRGDHGGDQVGGIAAGVAADLAGAATRSVRRRAARRLAEFAAG